MNNPYDISFSQWFLFFLTFFLGCLFIGFLFSLPRIIKNWAANSLAAQRKAELDARHKAVNERFMREWQSKGVRK